MKIFKGKVTNCVLLNSFHLYTQIYIGIYSKNEIIAMIKNENNFIGLKEIYDDVCESSSTFFDVSFIKLNNQEYELLLQENKEI